MDLDSVLSPRGLLSGLLVVLFVTVIIAGATSTQAFGAYNTAWDGTSGLRDVADAADVEHELILNIAQYPTENANGTVAFVLSPTEPYNTSERLRLRQFVEAGGTLVVAEDIGLGGNTVLESVGASARFDGRTLRDERNYDRTPAMPVATNVTDHRLTAGVDSVTLNHGTTIEPGNATVLVRSSEFAYLDVNGNEELDQNETLGSVPVATVEPVGSGQVVAVSDPSLFINAMLDRTDNRQFARAIIGFGDQLVLDYSHAGTQPPLMVALLTIRRTPLIQAVLGLLGVGLVVGWGRLADLVSSLRHRLRRDQPEVQRASDPMTLQAYLREQHPDWDEERLQRVIAGVMNHRREGDDNE